jgi:hypothetical protein
MRTVTVTIPIEEAEGILRKAATDAARYDAMIDHVTRATLNPDYCGQRSFDEARAEWRRRLAKAKATVECFGVSFEPTSEAETIGTGHLTKPAGTIEAAGLTFRRVEADLTKPRPQYRGSVHRAACEAAAERVILKWKESQ